MAARIEQVLDTKIRVTSAPAFSRVYVRVRSVSHGDVVIVLDMESTVEVLKAMDHGEQAIKRLRKWWDPRGWLV